MSEGQREIDKERGREIDKQIDRQKRDGSGRIRGRRKGEGVREEEEERKRRRRRGRRGRRQEFHSLT